MTPSETPTANCLRNHSTFQAKYCSYSTLGWQADARSDWNREGG